MIDLPQDQAPSVLVLLMPKPERDSDVFPLAQDLCTLGRSLSCHIAISNNLISRLHARIERSDVNYTLHDMESANGTFVNGERITRPHTLCHGDLIGLGGPLPVLRFTNFQP